MAFIRCPLTRALICDPVKLADGQICERAAIAEWFRRGHRSSPLTGLALQSLELTPVPQAQRTVGLYIDLYQAQEKEEGLPQLDPMFIDQAVTAFQKMYRAEVVLEKPGDFGWEVKVVPAEKNGASGMLGKDMQSSRIADLMSLVSHGRVEEIDHTLQIVENLVVYDSGDRIKNNEVALALRNSGGIKALADLAHSGTRSQQEMCAFILWKITIPENEVSMQQVGVPFALYTLLNDGNGTNETRIYAQNALVELEKVTNKRRLTVEVNDEFSDDRIPAILDKLSAGAPDSEAIDLLMLLADLTSLDIDNPIAIQTLGGIPIVLTFFQSQHNMLTRQAAAMVVLNISVPHNEAELRELGAVEALQSLCYEGEGHPTAQSMAMQALDAMMRLEADRRFAAAQKRAVW